MVKKPKQLNTDEVKVFYENGIKQSRSIEEALWGDLGNQGKRFRFVLQLLSRFGVSGRKMVDVGCGTGEFILEYILPLGLFKEYVGIDLLNLSKTDHTDFVFLAGDYRSFTKQCYGSDLLTCVGLLGTPGINTSYEFMSLIEFAQEVLLESSYLIITASAKTSGVGESVLSKGAAETILKDKWSGSFKFFDMEIDHEYVMFLSK